MRLWRAVQLLENSPVAKLYSQLDVRRSWWTDGSYLIFSFNIMQIFQRQELVVGYYSHANSIMRIYIFIGYTCTATYTISKSANILSSLLMNLSKWGESTCTDVDYMLIA